MKLTSREVLYHYQLKDLVSMENQIENAIESLAEAATNEQLKQAFESHHQETKEQLKQVQKLLEAAGKTARGRRCKGIESILTEGEEAANSTGKDTDAKDAALIAAARSVEHYETAAYLAAMDSARTLGLSEDERALTEIMRQEAEADRTLAAISQQITISNTEEDAEGGVPSSDSPVLERSQPMTPHTQYDQQQGNQQQGNYQGREYGGHRSAQMQDRDEQGRFTGYSGSPQNQNYNQDQHQGNYNQGGGNYGNPNYQNQGSFGGYEGRAQGGHHSAQMQGRDDQGQFTGYQGGQANYNPNYSQGGYGQGGYSQSGYNQGQSMGGQHSAQMQSRDELGQFTGYRGSPQHQGQYQGNYNQGGYNQGGQNYDNYQNQGNFGGYQGRSEGGQHSAQMQNRDDQGRFTGYQGSQANQGGYQGGNYGNPGGNYGGNQGGYNQGGYQGGQGGITDSAGRHYTQESWEAAQRGRSLGGQHSHGGGGNYR